MISPVECTSAFYQNTTQHSEKADFVILAQVNKPVLGVPRQQFQIAEYQAQTVQSNSVHKNRHQRVKIQQCKTDIIHYTIVQGTSTLSQTNILFMCRLQHIELNRTPLGHKLFPYQFFDRIA